MVTSLIDMIMLGESSEFFQLLSDKTRLSILVHLHEHDKGEMCFSDICEVLDLPGTTISYHLSRLKRCGVVTKRKEGKNRIYSIVKRNQIIYVIHACLFRKEV